MNECLVSHTGLRGPSGTPSLAAVLALPVLCNRAMGLSGADACHQTVSDGDGLYEFSLLSSWAVYCKWVTPSLCSKMVVARLDYREPRWGLVSNVVPWGTLNWKLLWTAPTTGLIIIIISTLHHVNSLSQQHSYTLCFIPIHFMLYTHTLYALYSYTLCFIE